MVLLLLYDVKRKIKSVIPCPKAKARVIIIVFFIDFPIEKSAIAVKWSGPKAWRIPYQKIII